MEATEKEQIFFQDQNVSVTNARFIAYGKTYAMRNISSVAFHKKEKSILLPVILLIIGGLICFGSVFVGILFILPSIIWIIANKPEYAVRINSNSGDIDGLVSTDKDYINKIVKAINDAIIHRR